MKKLAISVIILVLSISMSACSGDQDKEPEQTPPEATGQEQEDEGEQEGTEPQEEGPVTTQTVDGITISITGISVEPYKDADGEYDRRATLTYKIENSTDKAFGYSSMGWSGKMDDGYVLESWNNIMDMDLMQIPSNSEKEAEAYFLFENGVTVDAFTATYRFMDYNEDFWSDFGKMMTGEFTQDDYNEKYGKNIRELEFDVDVE